MGDGDAVTLPITAANPACIDKEDPWPVLSDLFTQESGIDIGVQWHEGVAKAGRDGGLRLLLFGTVLVN